MFFACRHVVRKISILELYITTGPCIMPIYSILLFFFTIANIAVPGTSSLWIYSSLGIHKTNILCCIMAPVGVILCGIYSLWTYNRIVLKFKTIHTSEFNDLNFREFSPHALLVLVLFMGIYRLFFHILFICQLESFYRNFY
jgi:NADH:ubiquinone oxidoreductase subunit 4 (subunit M)